MRRFDKMHFGSPNHPGLVFEAFDAPWWRLDRWAKWAVSPEKRYVKVSIRIDVLGEARSVRARALYSVQPHHIRE